MNTTDGRREAARREARDPMVWCDCLRATLPLTAKNAGLPCDVCYAEQQAAAA